MPCLNIIDAADYAMMMAALIFRFRRGSVYVDILRRYMVFAASRREWRYGGEDDG